jgi:hypothetical protein
MARDQVAPVTARKRIQIALARSGGGMQHNHIDAARAWRLRVKGVCHRRIRDDLKIHRPLVILVPWTPACGILLRARIVAVCAASVKQQERRQQNSPDFFH